MEGVPEGQGEDPQPNLELQVPEDLEGGTYSNFLAVWHTPYEFTLDFAVLQPPQGNPEDPDGLKVPARVVSRVKLPPTLVFDVMRALNENMARYEEGVGKIQPLGESEQESE